MELEGNCHEIRLLEDRRHEPAGSCVAVEHYSGVQHGIGASSYPVRLAVLGPREPIIAHGGFFRLCCLIAMIVAAHSFAEWFRPIVAEHLTGRDINAQQAYLAPPAKTQDRAPR